MSDSAEKDVPEKDGRLLWMLRVLGDEFGPLGVVSTAITLWDLDASVAFPDGSSLKTSRVTPPESSKP